MPVCLALTTFQFPITRTGSKAGSCAHRDNIRIRTILLFRTALLRERVARQRRVRVSRLGSGHEYGANDAHPALRATFSRREKDSLAA